MVAVGKRVTPLPPRRSRRALLTHRAPTLGRASDGERFGRAHRPAHNCQSDRRGCPALCPDRGRLTAVPLGPGPSLHVLRRKSPSIVRTLLRYYGPVRLLTHVHGVMPLSVGQIETNAADQLLITEAASTVALPRHDIAAVTCHGVNEVYSTVSSSPRPAARRNLRDNRHCPCRPTAL